MPLKFDYSDLTDYQKEAIDSIRENFDNCDKIIIDSIPSGIGKTSYINEHYEGLKPGEIYVPPTNIVSLGDRRAGVSLARLQMLNYHMPILDGRCYEMFPGHFLKSLTRGERPSIFFDEDWESSFRTFHTSMIEVWNDAYFSNIEICKKILNEVLSDRYSNYKPMERMIQMLNSKQIKSRNQFIEVVMDFDNSIKAKGITSTQIAAALDNIAERDYVTDRTLQLIDSAITDVVNIMLILKGKIRIPGFSFHNIDASYDMSKSFYENVKELRRRGIMKLSYTKGGK